MNLTMRFDRRDGQLVLSTYADGHEIGHEPVTVRAEDDRVVIDIGAAGALAVDIGDEDPQAVMRRVEAQLQRAAEDQR